MHSRHIGKAERIEPAAAERMGRCFPVYHSALGKASVSYQTFDFLQNDEKFSEV